MDFWWYLNMIIKEVLRWTILSPMNRLWKPSLLQRSPSTLTFNVLLHHLTADKKLKESSSSGCSADAQAMWGSSLLILLVCSVMCEQQGKRTVKSLTLYAATQRFNKEILYSCIDSIIFFCNILHATDCAVRGHQHEGPGKINLNRDNVVKHKAQLQ